MSKPDANKLTEDKCVGRFKTHSIRIKSLINATLIGCVEFTKTKLCYAHNTHLFWNKFHKKLHGEVQSGGDSKYRLTIRLFMRAILFRSESQARWLTKMCRMKLSSYALLLNMSRIEYVLHA